MKFTLITNPVADVAWVSTLLADYKHNGGFIGNDWYVRLIRVKR